MTDERANLVSASRFEILALCPGSESLRQQLPPSALQTGDEYSERGTTIHRAFETGSLLALDVEDEEIVRNAVRTEAEALERWQEQYGIRAYEEGPREERFWLHDETTLRPLTSAKLDRHFISTDPTGYIFCEDLKSLWCSNLTPAEANYQGRVQAVVSAKEYGANHVRMLFNKAMFASTDFADYNAEALWRAEFSIKQAIWEGEQAGAPLRPGTHCIHCPCKAYCPAALKEAVAPLRALQVTPSANGKMSKGQVAELVGAAPIEAVREVFGRRAVVRYIMEAVSARLKGLPEEELARLLLKLNAGRSTDYVRDVYGAFTALESAGYDAPSLWACLSFSKEKLVKLIQARGGLTGAAAETAYDRLLGEFIERGTGESILAEL